MSKERLLSRTKKPRNVWLLLPVLLILLILMSGCSETLSDGDFVLIGYTKEQDLQVYKERQTLQCPMMSNYIDGYLNLRDQVRVK